MATTTPHRSARLTAGLLAGGLLLGPLPGCSFSSHDVSCSGGSCTVTLSGDGTEVRILGTTLTFAGVQDGKASLSVGGASVSCGEGETVSAGPLRLECSSVADDSVDLTASVS